MCTICFAYYQHPKFPLLLLANRDEYYERPTAQAGPWPEAPVVYGGRDLQRGGMWLGVNQHGRFAAVTNVRNGRRHVVSELSRGMLVLEFLRLTATVDEFIESIRKNRSRYGGFNLLFGSLDSLWYYGNGADSLQRLTPGVFGISNAELDTPWPKVTSCKSELRKRIDEEVEDLDTYLEILNDRRIHPDRTLPSTGIELELERQLSALRVDVEGYGTRCSSVLAIGSDNLVRFRERSFQPVMVSPAAGASELSKQEIVDFTFKI